MTESPRLSIIPGWIVLDPRLKGRDLQVLCVLGQNASTKSGWLRRSQVKIAEALGCARSTVQASIDRLVEIGAVEKHVVESSNGRDSAHFYRVIYDRAPPSGYDFDAWLNEEEEENIPADEGESAPTPAGISAGGADPGAAPPADSGPAPINASTLTPAAERTEREARERVDPGFGSVVNAKLTKRVQRFCTGEGYREGAWPKWAKSTVGHIAKQFAQLTPDEQAAAEEWRDPFLVKCRRDGIATPMPVANFFRDKVWDMLDPADKSAVRPVAGGAPASATGKVMVPVFGPAYGAARAWSLVNGPVRFDLPPDLRDLVQATYEAHLRRSAQSAHGYLVRLGVCEDNGRLLFPDGFEAQERARRAISEGFPEANRLHDAAKDHRAHVSVAPVFERVKALCVPVKVDSPLWDEWRDFHEARGWPFVPRPAGMNVVYFPKDGPQGLDAFERAVRAVMNGDSERIEGDVHAAAE